jgi:hypothetical protein
MTAKIDAIPRALRRTFVAAILTASAMTAAQAAPEALKVVLDQATILKLPDGASTIVVGNPLIADVSVQAGGLVVVTGKGYGTTNLLALDRSGATLMERALEVRGGGDSTVFVFRGAERESYACAPNCERRITLGDSPAFFTATSGQVDTRNQQAAGAAKPPGAK